MSLSRGASPLNYRRIARSELGAVGALQFHEAQVERFLGPLPEILDAVRRGPAHAMTGIVATGELIGFYVIHPDRRDRSCWWLGWFAIDGRKQGCGYGRAAMLAIMDRLRRIEGCRRIRLLVASDNSAALSLYGRARFQRVGLCPGTGELVMECVQASGVPNVGGAGALQAGAVMPLPVFADRLRVSSIVLATRLCGAVHGPPGTRGRLAEGALA